jgi:hypothetical protein
VQGIVCGSNLPVYSASLQSPTQNSVEFSLASSIDTPGGITAVLEPLPIGLASLNNKTPFTTLLIPETNLRGTSNITVTNQTVKIVDRNSFVSFLESALYSTSFKIVVTGTTDTFIGAIKAPIKLNKQIEMAGMDLSHFWK